MADGAADPHEFDAGFDGACKACDSWDQAGHLDDMTVAERETGGWWSVLVTVSEPLTREQRDAIFAAVCAAVEPFYASTADITVSGQPANEVFGG